jgi:hexosaminidase
MPSRQAVLAALLFFTLASCARPARPPRPDVRIPTQTLVPLPAVVEARSGPPFTITATTKILVTPGDSNVRRIGLLAADLLTFSEQSPLVVEDAPAEIPAGHLHLAIGPGQSQHPESYEITIATDAVSLRAPSPAGLFYALQTLRQLLPPAVEHRAARPVPLSLEPVHIADTPRYAWRGAMLDVSRHFFRPPDVKRYIDLIAMLKINRLHLVLSNDQGWRLEIKSWPNLARHGGSTEVGGGPGGYYTQAEYAQLVAYAADRFITIVPEIDMPGHTNAALSSYPELNCNGVAPALYSGIEVGFSTLCVDKDITYKFLDDVVREIAALTPGQWFHIGGDEVEKLTPEQYNRFIDRAQRIVDAHGKHAIGWDEIGGAPLLPNSVVQHWRPKADLREVAAKRAKVIMSPAHRTYLDMKYDEATPIGLNWAGLIPFRTAYDWDPEEIAKDLPPQSILGVEAPLWSETIATMQDIELLVFPRLAAIAEIAWSPRLGREWNSFSRRVGAQAARWSALGINFYRSPDVDWKH